MGIECGWLRMTCLSVFQYDKAEGGRGRGQQAVRLPRSRLQEALQEHQRHQIPREERAQEGWTVSQRFILGVAGPANPSVRKKFRDVFFLPILHHYFLLFIFHPRMKVFWWEGVSPKVCVALDLSEYGDECCWLRRTNHFSAPNLCSSPSKVVFKISENWKFWTWFTCFHQGWI